MPTPLESPAAVREPNLLKFGLRQMFGGVTVVGLICGLMAITEGPWPWVVLISAVLVAGHIFGNFIGTRLRNTSEDVVRWRRSDPRTDSDDPYTTPLADAVNLPVAEPNLANFGCLVRGHRWYLLGGASAGTVAAGTLLNLTIGYRISWAGWAVGTLSGTIMGFWAAFLAVSFTTIARDALRQAHGK